MKETQLPHLTVASPCSANWDSMTGDAKVRFCGQCNLHVYNISEMSREDATALVINTEGRLCARFYRRPDGTVLTKDCPTGLRAIRVRASRAAGAVLSAILSLFSGTAARATSMNPIQGSIRRQVVVKRTVITDTEDASASLTGTIFDQLGAVIPNAKIIILNKKTKKEMTTTSNEEGVFRAEKLEAGEYTITVESPGFSSFKTTLSLNPKESVRVDLTLEVAATMGDVVILEEQELKTEKTPPPEKLKPRQ